MHGHVLELKSTGPTGERLWAYRYRLDGRGSRRLQRGGFATAEDARDALRRELAAVQRRKGRARVTLPSSSRSTSPSTTLSPRRQPSCAGCSARPPPSSGTQGSPSSTRARSPPGG